MALYVALKRVLSEVQQHEQDKDGRSFLRISYCQCVARPRACHQHVLAETSKTSHTSDIAELCIVTMLCIIHNHYWFSKAKSGKHRVITKRMQIIGIVHIIFLGQALVVSTCNSNLLAFTLDWPRNCWMDTLPVP